MSDQKKTHYCLRKTVRRTGNTMTVGSRGPVLIQDYILHEKMAHFNRERIPERVVHAKGTGAYAPVLCFRGASKDVLLLVE